jgi:antitoxin (DNA-binding transcriptional repressor) of toxin-antitoxin stability system
MKTYTTEEARAKLGQIIIDALAGEHSVITYHGIPAAMLISIYQAPVTVTDSDSGTATEAHHR